MKYYSTKNKNVGISFKEAVIQGLPADNGLFMPANIPKLPKAYFKAIQDKQIQQIAYDVLNPFLADTFSQEKLLELIQKTFSFPFPLVEIQENIYALELFHGPSLAFKDVGATFLALCLDEFYRDADEKCTILVATSGDTGGAVAAAFSQTKNIEVVILYPSGKVSELQEKQLTTYDKNVTALEVEGDFDDCQALVKQAFLDAALREQLVISSANSINIARLLPQMIYYFAPFIALGAEKIINIAVPSGNYGNLTAGLLAQEMGLPVNKFLAAANKNDVVPRFLSNGQYEPKATIPTISNAMDVGNPSNFSRLIALWSYDKLTSKVSGFTYSDEQTLACMENVYKKSQYLLDPHAAVGFQAIAEYLEAKKEVGIVLETAHPCKFMNVVTQLTDQIEIPEQVQKLMNRHKKSIKMRPNYDDFKAFLLK